MNRELRKKLAIGGWAALAAISLYDEVQKAKLRSKVDNIEWRQERQSNNLADVREHSEAIREEVDGDYEQGGQL